MEGSHETHPISPILSNDDVPEVEVDGPREVEAQESDQREDLPDMLCQPCEQEAREPMALTDPGKPTAEMVAKHNITHLPFRAWCPDCVRGRAPAGAHYKQKKDDQDQRIPTISYDYGFANELQDEDEKKAEKESDDEEKKHEFKLLVVKDQRTK